MVLVEKRRVEREWWVVNTPIGSIELHHSKAVVHTKGGDGYSIHLGSWPAVREAVDALCAVWLEQEQEKR